MVKATKKPLPGGKKISKKGSSSSSKKKKKSSTMPPSSTSPSSAAGANVADAAPPLRPDTPSLGMRTSSIANKLVRKEQYAKLKHKQKVNRENMVEREENVNVVDIGG